jgi:hypothetical protein
MAGLALFAAAAITCSLSSTRAQDAGAAPATSPAAPTTNETGPAKFYGTVSAVDTKAMTFTVDNQVYHVIGETHMTKAADDKAATLADAVVGEPARGSYTKAADGTLNVTKVRFGKKGGGKGGGGKTKSDAASQPQKQ